MSRTVLVVDDEEDIREIACLALSLSGIDAVPVATGQEAAAAVVELQPDAVLLDVMMPGQDGPTTLAQLRRDDRTAAVPIVFLTAKAQPREHAELMAMGADGVLLKPFDPMLLGAQLADILGW